MAIGPKKLPLKLKGKEVGEVFLDDRGNLVGTITNAQLAVDLGFYDVDGISIYANKKEDKK